MRFARVDFGGVRVDPALREKWQGKLVEVNDGNAWHLGGYPYEGIALDCPDGCLVPLGDEEQGVAELLGLTFWVRTAYTENRAALEGLLHFFTDGRGNPIPDP